MDNSLFRLQIGFDKGRFDMGILLLNQFRSEKSPLGNNIKLVKQEVEALFPTISMPVSIVLFDLSKPQCLDPDPVSPSAKSAVNGGFPSVVSKGNESTIPTIVEIAPDETKTPKTLKEVA